MDWTGKEYYANKFQPVLNDPNLSLLFFFVLESTLNIIFSHLRNGTRQF